MTKDELYILSYYRASELAGSLLFGKLAMYTDIDELRIPLTEQCSEEAKHAWLLTETIHNLGEVPLKITDTFQSEIAKEFGMPRNILEILCLTQVFEERVLDHYINHMNMKGLNPRIKQTLQSMIADEEGHVDWIEKELGRYIDKNGASQVNQCMKRIRTIDKIVHNKLSVNEPFSRYFKEIL